MKTVFIAIVLALLASSSANAWTYRSDVFGERLDGPGVHCVRDAFGTRCN